MARSESSAQELGRSAEGKPTAGVGGGLKRLSAVLFFSLLISLASKADGSLSQPEGDKCIVEVDAVRVDLASGADATSTIQSAIDRCFLAGGGTVHVPTGRYGVKTLRLRSNVTLHLERDAKLVASRQPDDYAGLIRQDRVEPLPESFFESRGVGVKESTNRWCRAVVRVFKAHDVSIVGEEGSEIDGRNCFDPNGEEKYRGPHAICVNLSTNVTLSGYTVRDAGNYAHYQ